MNLFLLVNNVIVYHQMTRISRTSVSSVSSDDFFLPTDCTNYTDLFFFVLFVFCQRIARITRITRIYFSSCCSFCQRIARIARIFRFVSLRVFTNGLHELHGFFLRVIRVLRWQDFYYVRCFTHVFCTFISGKFEVSDGPRNHRITVSFA